MKTLALPRPPVTLAGLLLLTAVVSALVTALVPLLPPAGDWIQVFAPAARGLVEGRNPYTLTFVRHEGFFNPPWVLLLLAPFAADVETGRAALLVVALLAYAVISARMEASPLAMALVLLSLPVLIGLNNGNIDWLVLCGLLLPPRWGLLLVMAKPQIGVGVAVLWTVEAWQSGRAREVARLWLPVGVALLVSLAIYGLWPLHALGQPEQVYNFSLWRFGPVTAGLSLLAGLGCLAWAVRHHSVPAALLAAPLLAPFVSPHGWGVLPLALAGHTRACAAVWLLLWGVALL